MAQYLMALDAGTGSIRAVLFDTEGNEQGVCALEWEHSEDPRFHGSMDFDWVAGWDKTVKCIKGVLEKTGIAPRDITAISTTCMREGIVLYDKEGREIFACANVDARAEDEVKQLIEDDPSLEKELYARSGQSFALDALPRLLWVKNKLPEVYEKTDKVGMFNDWLIFKLTGVLAVEPSNGSTSGLMDLATRTWDKSMLERVGLHTDILPDVVESGTRIASVSAEAAGQTGLTEGTPVVVGGGDAQLGCIGVGVTSPDEAAIFGGSFWQYEYNTGVAMTDALARVRVNCHAVLGVWQYEALAFKPGLVMRWYRDGFCQAEKEISAACGIDVYDVMNEAAQKVPAGSYGMCCAFSDVMNFVSWKHASPTFTNFDLDAERFNKYTFYRAILENTALVTYGHMKLVEESTSHLPAEVSFASGASKSPLWSQILADVLGIPVHVPVVKEATALGCAILAGYGVGIYDDISLTAKRLAKTEHTFTPDEANHALYMDLYEKWRALYREELALADKGLTRHMWKAPGV